MIGASPEIHGIHMIIARHGRKYCIFSVAGRDVEFLYCNHESNQVRSLVFGRDFTRRLPPPKDDGNLCIECGLGLSAEGGVSLDGGDCIEWHFSVHEANRILTGLKTKLGDEGTWIGLF